MNNQRKSFITVLDVLFFKITDEIGHCLINCRIFDKGTDSALVSAVAEILKEKGGRDHLLLKNRLEVR